MTTCDARQFDVEWPALAEKLRRSLAARGVPAQDRDDVVQETALRVYRVWDTLDPDRSVWPYVVTVGVNYWRDVMRERTGRIAQVYPTPVIEATDHQDVERDVLARQEFARVGLAMRALAPEQRRLLLASEEFTDTVRPLRPAERVARMRVRRQLARTVGRASAALFLVWLRRPARSTGVVAAAYAGAMAAAVLTAPAMVPAPMISAVPKPVLSHHQPLHHPQRHVPARAGTTAAQAPAGPAVLHSAQPLSGGSAAPEVADPSMLVGSHRARLCAPMQLPLDAVSVGVEIGSTTVYGFDPTGKPEAITATPQIVARATHGCLAIR